MTFKDGDTDYSIDLFCEANLTQVATGTFIPNSTSRETATIDMITGFPDILTDTLFLTIVSPRVPGTHCNEKCQVNTYHTSYIDEIVGSVSNIYLFVWFVWYLLLFFVYFFFKFCSIAKIEVAPRYDCNVYFILQKQTGKVARAIEVLRNPIP